MPFGTAHIAGHSDEPTEGSGSGRLHPFRRKGGPRHLTRGVPEPSLMHRIMHSSVSQHYNTGAPRKKRKPPQMSDNRAPDATRSGVAAGTMPNRYGRLDGRAWRDVERAVKIGKKNDAYAVEVHGVRVLFKIKGAQEQPQEPTGSKGGRTRATRQPNAPTCEPAPEPSTKAPNSAQRRSARRLEAYLAKKPGQERTALAPGSDAKEAVTPAQVDYDARMDGEPTTAATPGRGGQKRAAVEPTSCSQPKAAAAQQQQPQRQRVESTPAAAPPRAARDISPRPSRERCLTTCRTLWRRAEVLYRLRPAGAPRHAAPQHRQVEGGAGAARHATTSARCTARPGTAPNSARKERGALSGTIRTHPRPGTETGSRV